MAQYRQSGADRFTGRTTHDFHHHSSSSSNNGGVGSDQVSIRVPNKQGRIRRPGHKGQRRISVAAIAVTIGLGLLVSLSVFHYLSRDKEVRGRLDDDDQEQEGERKHETDFHFRPKLNRSLAFKELRFGKGSTAVGRDSRYWDRDDRRRDDEYDEYVSELSNIPGGNGGNRVQEDGRNIGDEQLASGNGREGKSGEKQSRSRGLYNEAGRTELKMYEEKYEESLKNVEQSERGNGAEQVNSNDEYDDGFDMDDANEDGSDDPQHGDGDHHDEAAGMEKVGDGRVGHMGSRREVETSTKGAFADKFEKGASVVSSKSMGYTKMGHRRAGAESTRLSSSEKKSSTKGRPKRGKGCEMKFLNSTDLILEPLENKRFSRFSLQFTEVEERPNGVEKWEPRFAGHQSLQEREESFYARNQKINCGFIKGPKGMPSTGFDLAEDDVRFMSSCHIAVSSCIFGNSDNLRTPNSKTITRSSRKNVCFVMFVDENTLQTLSAEGQKPDRMGFIGPWKIVVVKNLPYTDMRRVGKVPKFLTHRLFPSSRYSIWLDSKLRLQSDPLLLLEYFLWRKGSEYAISNHYDRHCVWEEVLQNKKLNKFNHTIIDEQFAFYQADGLKRFNPVDPNKLLPSYVPEGSFIMRAHTPMSNLFSCLWFNEVDRFTPRDQLSFAYTYLKLRKMNPRKSFHLNMFKDCERRSIAKLFRHRAEDKRNIPTQAVGG